MDKFINAQGLTFKPPVIAHRGASAYAPENTLAAFKKAKELGASWIEFDVMLTADKEVVVFHDETLERTTNGQGPVSERPGAYLKTLDAGSWFQAQFIGEKIPTLSEVLEFLRQYPLLVNIEIKAFPGQEKEIVSQVFKVLNREWPKNIPAPLMSSFSMAVLRAWKMQSTDYAIGFLMDNIFSQWEQAYQELQASSLNVNQSLLDSAATVNFFKQVAGSLLAYTVNDPQRARELLSWGVDAVFTDCPDKMVKEFL